MKKLILTFLSCILFIYAQNSSRIEEYTPIISNLNRYKVDYEIKNTIDVPKEVDLNKIDFRIYDIYRKIDEDVEVYDPYSGFIIILYSENKSNHNKSNQTK